MVKPCTSTEEIKSKKGFVKICPKTLQEIKNSQYEKFLIKIGASYCPPCKELERFIESDAFKPTGVVPVYFLELDGENKDLAREISREIGCRSVPYCYITNRSLTKLNLQVGFNREAFTKMIEENF